MYKESLFKCNLNCAECNNKECELREKPNRQEQLSIFDKTINNLKLNSDDKVINSLTSSISAFEDADEKIDFIKRCLEKYIQDLIEQNAEKVDSYFLKLHFEEFCEYIAKKILENSK